MSNKVMDILESIKDREFIDGFNIEKYLKPKVGEFTKVYEVAECQDYYFVDTFNEVCSDVNGGFELDKILIANGVVLTREEADVYRKARIDLFKLQSTARDMNKKDGFVLDWKDLSQGKYVLYLHHTDGYADWFCYSGKELGLFGIAVGTSERAKELISMFTYEEFVSMSKSVN